MRDLREETHDARISWQRVGRGQRSAAAASGRRGRVSEREARERDEERAVERDEEAQWRSEEWRKEMRRRNGGVRSGGVA